MAQAAAASLQEQNKHLIHRWFEEVWNQGRRESILELFDVNAVLYDAGKVIHGPQEFLAFYDSMHQDLTDFKITPLITLGENDLVCMRWTLECRHAAKNKKIEVSGTSIARVRDGRFVEAWQNWDVAGFNAQLAE